jgi:hypothetical protein
MPLTSPRWQQFAQIIHDAPPVRPEEADYAFKIVDSGRELLQAFGLLYREYLQAGYVCQSPSELLFTRHHLLPETTVFVAKVDSAVLSTATVVQDCRVFGLPMDGLYQSELDTLRKQGRRILEICSLASDRQRFTRKGIQDFTRLLFLFCLHLNVDDLCIMINPKHASLYTCRCEFEIFGQEKFYPRVQAPAIALRADARMMREKLKDKGFASVTSTSLPTQCNATRFTLCDNVTDILKNGSSMPRFNPLNANMVKTLLALTCPTQLELSPEYVSFLKNEYPGI